MSFKRKNGSLYYDDHPEFNPNLTPRQIFKLGSFGGTYWRPIHSTVTGQDYQNGHYEFPASWWEGISESHLSSSKCDPTINKYKVKSGTSLKYWESKDWINSEDPFGWVQWYCRFHNGRRTKDDKRQIDRYNRFAGPNGRFRNALINEIKRKNKTYDDFSVSPVKRQALQQWGYRLTKKDFNNKITLH